MNRNVEDLVTRINERYIEEDFQEDLIIFDEEEIKRPNELLKSKEYKLFQELSSTNLSNKKKGSRFSNEQLEELKILLKRYPGDHIKIRKALKIPPSTFCRLKQKIEFDGWKMNTIKQKWNLKSSLDFEKKAYVSRLVQPPTVPITTTDI